MQEIMLWLLLVKFSNTNQIALTSTSLCHFGWILFLWLMTWRKPRFRISSWPKQCFHNQCLSLVRTIRDLRDLWQSLERSAARNNLSRSPLTCSQLLLQTFLKIPISLVFSELSARPSLEKRVEVVFSKLTTSAARKFVAEFKPTWLLCEHDECLNELIYISKSIYPLL